MAKFYFTYGCGDEQPYVGGWTEVDAPSETAAISAFRAYHPSRADGFVNCAGIYTEAAFAKSKMGRTGENFGVGCREQITLCREEVRHEQAE